MIQVPVLMAAAVHQWEHLISPVSVQLVTLDLPVRLTLMIVCLQPAQATACVWTESIPLCALACLDLRTPIIIVSLLEWPHQQH